MRRGPDQPMRRVGVAPDSQGGDPGALVRVFGVVGAAGPEDGVIVRMDTATAIELESRGDAVRVAIAPAAPADRTTRGPAWCRPHD